MKVVVNTRLLRKGEMDGIGWFTYNTFQYIVRQNPDVEFHFLFDSGIDKEFLFADNIVPHNLFPPAKHALLNLAWFELSVRMFLNKINPQVFISPDGLLCAGWTGKQYGVIHDINHFHNPKDLKWSNRTYYNYVYPRFAKQACRIGTVSEYSKKDIAKHYHINENKIDVLYNGVNNFFYPLSAERKSTIKAELTGGKDYFVFIGTLHPRKNINRLLQAFDLFKAETAADIQLVLAGKPLFQVEEIYAQHQQMKSREDVKFIGRVSDDKINDVLGAALALTFVPVFEGFGIPIIEAMQCEVPVVCSDVTSMPEVAGDAALLVNPLNVTDIKNAMVNVYKDASVRQGLIEKGRIRKDFFSWEKTARLFWEGVNKCL